MTSVQGILQFHTHPGGVDGDHKSKASIADVGSAASGPIADVHGVAPLLGVMAIPVIEKEVSRVADGRDHKRSVVARAKQNERQVEECGGHLLQVVMTNGQTRLAFDIVIAARGSGVTVDVVRVAQTAGIEPVGVQA